MMAWNNSPPLPQAGGFYWAVITDADEQRSGSLTGQQTTAAQILRGKIRERGFPVPAAPYGTVPIRNLPLPPRLHSSHTNTNRAFAAE